MPDPGGVPFLVGLCGHRDIASDDVARLEAELGAIFTALQARLGATRIVVASGLAEGADRIAWRVARAHGCGTIAVLPKAREVYEGDFQSESSRGEFAALFAQADAVEVLGGEHAGYERLGVWLARHTQLLIALWDGEPAQDKGGTGHVVALKLGYALDEGLDLADAGPVVHLHARHAVHPENAGRSAMEGLRVLFPGHPSALEQEGSTLDVGLRRFSQLALLARYNDEAPCVRLAGVSSPTALSSMRELGPRPEIERLVSQFERADELARVMRRRRVLSLRIVTWTNTLALFFFLIGTSTNNPGPVLWGIGAWLVLLALNLAYFLRLRGLQVLSFLLPSAAESRVSLGVWEGASYHRKHLEYRALAEGLRVSIAWRAAGIAGDVADRFLLKQISEVTWIRSALRACCVQVPRTEPGFEADVSRRFAWVLDNWVKEEERYYRTTAERRAKQLTVARRWIQACLLLGLLGGMALLTVPSSPQTPTQIQAQIQAPPRAQAQDNTQVLASALTIFSGACFLVAAAVAFLRERFLIGEEFGLFTDLGALHRAELRRLECSGDAVRKRADLERLGLEALVESGLWLTLHRSRPTEGWKPG